MTFGAAKDTLRLVVDNGVDVTDDRILRRTNEAIQELLCAVDPRTDQMLVPVGCFASYQVTTTVNGILLLPKELENAVSWFVVPPATGYGNPDVSQGYTQLTNPSTYVDPTLQHDNPLEYQGLAPDPDDPTILRVQLRYQSLGAGAVVSLTGKRRFQPITGDADYLIIPNVPAVKLMIQAIEYRENRDPSWKDLKMESVKILSDECKNHQMDPTDTMRHKSDYESDLTIFPEGTMGFVRARMALEVPGMMQMGRIELARALNQAMREAVDHFNYLGRTERYSLEDGPNQIVLGAQILDPALPLPFSNFEVLRLLMIAQRVPPAGVQQPEDAAPGRQTALSLIERDMAQASDSARTAAHLAALSQYPIGSKGWTVGRIGLELPKALEFTVNRLTGALERAELRLMEDGTWKGCVEEFNATITNGHIYWPARVETVLAIILHGHHAPIRSIFYKYVKDGPGQCGCTCEGRFEDEGEKYFPNSGDRRRVYRALMDGEGTKITAVCKLRWAPKELEDQMTIQNLNALRIMTDGILTQQDDAAAASAEMILNKELREYLKGIELTFPNLSYAGVGDLGGVL